MRCNLPRRPIGQRRDSGYMLLVLMLAVAMLTITLLQVSLNYRRSIQRDREVEMIHRGVQYERAVRLYFRKFGAYPTTIEQLEDTNKLRFLRKRYKDPMSPDGQWQIAHITDIKLTGASLTALAAAASGAGAAGTANQAQAIAGGLAGAATASAFGTTPSTQSATGSSIFGSSGTTAGTGSTAGTDTGGTTGATGSTGGQTTGTNSSGDNSQTPQGTGSGTGPADSNSTSANGAGPLLGGGPMLGVISKSKAEGIHSFNDKSHYNEWYFIYDPSQDKGQLLTGPYNPNLALGLTTTTTGTPAGQPGANSAAPNATTPGAATSGTPTPATPPSTTPGP